MDINLLVSLHQLIQAQEAPKPTPTVLRLQVVADLVHHSRPMAGKVMFDDSTEAHCQLCSMAGGKEKYIVSKEDHGRVFNIKGQIPNLGLFATTDVLHHKYHTYFDNTERVL